MSMSIVLFQGSFMRMESAIPADGIARHRDELKKPLNIIILVSVWLGICAPLLIALFFFSNSRLRRKPIFIFNALSICGGVAMGILNVRLLIPTVVDPIVPIDRRTVMAFALFCSSTPIFVESILVFRLLVVFPYSQTPSLIFYCIFVPLALLKAARVANLIEFTVNFGRSIQHTRTSAEMGALRFTASKVEWFLQIFDNTFASVLFLWRLNVNNSLFPVRQTDRPLRVSFSARISTLFWIAMSNFVFPVIVSISLLIIYFHETDYIAWLPPLISNAYIEIIGVLMATVWAASSHWQENGDELSNDPRISSFRFDGTGRVPRTGTVA